MTILQIKKKVNGACCALPCGSWIDGPVQSHHFVIRLRQVLHAVVSVLCKHDLEAEGRSASFLAKCCPLPHRSGSDPLLRVQMDVNDASRETGEAGATER